MRISKFQLASVILVIVSIALAVYAYNDIPGDTIDSHWNAKGQADDKMDKLWGLGLFPGICLLLTVFFFLIPRIDPLKKNIKKFGSYYEGFIVVFLIFLIYVQVLTIVWNLGYMYNMSIAILPAFGFLFYYLGTLLKHAKRNWFIGIRTPWTISNDKVWEKTHELGSKLFKALSVYSILLVFAQSILKEKIMLAFLIPVIGVALLTVIYSYWAYSKEKS